MDSVDQPLIGVTECLLVTDLRCVAPLSLLNSPTQRKKQNPLSAWWSDFNLSLKFSPSSFLLRIKAAATLVMRQAGAREAGVQHSQVSAAGIQQLLGLE